MKLPRYYAWMVALAFVCLAFFIRWYERRRQIRQGAWKYTKEILPELGKVDVSYQDGKLVWYRLRRHGVLLEILCENSEAIAAGIRFAQSVSGEELDRHLQQAVRAIPEADLRPWGFEKGTWNLETVIIRGEDSLGFELGNSSDRDHVCLVSVEKGKYEFEGVDG